MVAVVSGSTGSEDPQSKGDDSASVKTSDNLNARRERDKSAARSMAWSGAGRYAGQIFRWTSTFFVARLLTPEDYGLVGMTTIFSGLVALVAEFGVGAAVLRMRDLDNDQLRQLNAVALILGAIAMLVSVASAWPIALFFRRPELILIIVASSLGFFLSSFQTVPSALLQRATNFRAVAQIEFVGAVLVAALVLLLAVAGAGYWALVIPSVIVAAITSVWLQRLAGVGTAWPRLEQTREAIRYSLLLLSGRVTGYLFSNADAVVAGRVLGSSAFGSYSMAWDLANTPNDQINGLVARVSASYYSALQNDKVELTRFFVLLLEFVAFITLPLVIGLALVAPEFVQLVLGPKWSGVVSILRILCVVAALRITTILANPLLAMLGDAAFQSRVGFASLVIVPPLLFLGGRGFGTVGLAAVWLFVYPVLIVIAAKRAGRLLQVRSGRILGALAPALVCSGLMGLSVLATGFALPASTPVSLRFLALVSTGAVAYSAAALLLYRDRIATFHSFATSLRTAE